MAVVINEHSEFIIKTCLYFKGQGKEALKPVLKNYMIYIQFN
jgi:hypothetical protein